MSKIIILLSIVSFFLFSCAPHIDYYSPLVFFKKEQFINTQKLEDYYYIIDVKNFSSMKTKLFVSSLPKEKTIYFDVIFVENRNIDSVKIESNRVNFKLYEKQNKNVKKRENIFYKTYNLNDSKWYGEFNRGVDTLTVKMYIENEVITIPYYFNYKNRLETYPF